jgi:hypothetical protein
MRPGKLDGCFHALASRRTEESLREAAAGAITQFLGQFPGKVCNMSLNHCRAASLQFILQRANDLGMVVANVVDAVTGEKVEDPPSVVGEQFSANAPFITHVHL